MSYTETGWEITYDPQKGAIKTKTYESFDGDITVPDGEVAVGKSYSEGKWTLKTQEEQATSEPEGEGEGNPEPIVSGQASLSQEPLATHPMFGADGVYTVTEEEWQKWKKWVADPNDESLAGWTPNDAVGISKFYNYWTKGVEDFLCGGVTLRRTTYEAEIPSLAGLGKIATPPDAPTLPDQANWILAGVNWDRQGTSGPYTVSREYRSSGPAGWDAQIYGDA